MDSMTFPATILLYITGAAFGTNVVVNGIRNSVVLPALVAFGIAVLFGVGFMVLFMVANSVSLTFPTMATAIIAGVVAAGASAGINSIHNRTLPTATRTP